MEDQGFIDRLNHVFLFDNWDEVSSGKVLTDWVIADSEKLLIMDPSRDVWAKLDVAALDATLYCSGMKGRTNAQEPWNKISKWLDKYGEDHGWELNEND